MLQRVALTTHAWSDGSFSTRLGNRAATFILTHPMEAVSSPWELFGPIWKEKAKTNDEPPAHGGLSSANSYSSMENNSPRKCMRTTAASVARFSPSGMVAVPSSAFTRTISPPPHGRSRSSIIAGRRSCAIEMEFSLLLVARVLRERERCWKMKGQCQWKSSYVIPSLIFVNLKYAKNWAIEFIDSNSDPDSDSHWCNDDSQRVILISETTGRFGGFVHIVDRLFVEITLCRSPSMALVKFRCVRRFYWWYIWDKMACWTKATRSELMKFIRHDRCVHFLLGLGIQRTPQEWGIVRLEEKPPGDESDCHIGSGWKSIEINYLDFPLL